jgi:hypothetical protein
MDTGSINYNEPISKVQYYCKSFSVALCVSSVALCVTKN